MLPFVVWLQDIVPCLFCMVTRLILGIIHSYFCKRPMPMYKIVANKRFVCWLCHYWRRTG